MLKTATSTSQPLEIAIELEKMAQTVLLIGEWLLKQQQQLKQQQRKLQEKQRLIEEQQQEIEQLQEALDKLKTAPHQIVLSPLRQTSSKSLATKVSEKKGKNESRSTTIPARPETDLVNPIKS